MGKFQLKSDIYHLIWAQNTFENPFLLPLLLIISLPFHFVEKYTTKSRNLTARSWKFTRNNSTDAEYQIVQWMKGEGASIREPYLSAYESDLFSECSQVNLLCVLLSLTVAGYYFQLLGTFDFSNDIGYWDTVIILSSARTHISLLHAICVGNIGLLNTKKLRNIASNQCWTNNLELDN